MGYAQKFDANSQIVREGISAIVQAKVGTAAVLTDHVFTVPKGTFGFTVKRLPVGATVSVNGGAHFIVDEGDYFSPFVDTIESFKITTTATGTTDIVIQFIV